VYTESVVDLELADRGGEVEQLAEQYAEALSGTSIELVRTEKSASFRLHVPKIEPPAFDEAAVRVALTAARTLKTWWQRIVNEKRR
jgi:hypothetical protein